MSTISLPIIDFGAYLDPSSTSKQRSEVDHAIDDAFRRFGVLYLQNHGVPLDLYDKIRALGHQFFGLPLEEKRKHLVGSQVRGYCFPDETIIETHGTYCEGIAFYPPVNHYSNGLAPDADPDSPDARLPTSPDALGGQDSWPGDEFRALVEEYLEHIAQLNKRMLASIAASLGLSALSHAQLQDTVTHITFNGYPPLSSAQIENGGQSMPEHKDPGCLTYLNQDIVSASLQIQDRDGQWCGVPPIPGTFIVNVGTVLSQWTGGQYVDILHRVIHCHEKSRVSVATLVDPPFDHIPKPLSEFATGKNDLAKDEIPPFGSLYVERYG
ncbi:hypothetical protein THASP1DRAFT_32651 [Thamnocephalis sphaerospora]|uniref:Fe2OG dioxygenase domain-containing protein n=1 Tax=Thamnocephalis sphaerospora TaxID=78915 RepID=A0A4P9XII3_9FUNG|nr:hypothetical protein THASP1DRAFT_32651 [Thamnocephalis sphaerospora]|eukprot:RKP05508.1 hypothetical protein THASP1DRAFT_32651 [Thamnocephalis sphaerospora]